MNTASDVSTVLPLVGIRVVSMALNLPGPACVRRLANFGASVIKVEPPDALGGDPLRIYANNTLIAHGEVSVDDGHLRVVVSEKIFKRA